MSENARRTQKEFALIKRRQRALNEVREALLCDKCETKETCLIQHNCKEDLK